MEYPVIDIIGTGRQIDELRRLRGIKVEELRVYLGMNNTVSIYRWLRGETLPTLDNIYALSRILGVSVDEIIITM